jgi:hypothetical protein
MSVEEPKIVGYFVWWSIVNQPVKRDVMQSLIHKVGLKDKEGKECILDPQKDYKSFLRAVRAVKYQYKDRGLLIRKIKKDFASYVFGLTDEKIYEREVALKYTHKATLHYFPKTGKLRVDKPHQAFDLIKDLYELYKSYLDGNAIREFVMQVLGRITTIAVRPRGGIYFIPTKHKETIEKLEKLFKLLPSIDENKAKPTIKTFSGNYFAAIPQADTEEIKQAMHRSFVAEAKTRLAIIDKDLEKLGITQMLTLHKRREDLQTLLGEINFYKDTMGFQVADIQVATSKLIRKATYKIDN